VDEKLGDRTGRTKAPRRATTRREPLLGTEGAYRGDEEEGEAMLDDDEGR